MQTSRRRRRCQRVGHTHKRQRVGWLGTVGQRQRKRDQISRADTPSHSLLSLFVAPCLPFLGAPAGDDREQGKAADADHPRGVLGSWHSPLAFA
jgi:hypothetical protein